MRRGLLIGSLLALALGAAATVHVVSLSQTAPAAGPSTGTILFRMNFAADAYPSAGWDGRDCDGNVGMGRRRHGERWTSVHVPGGGPQGQDAIEIREIGTGEHDQHGWGWHGDVGEPLRPGEARYYRWRFLQTADSDCRGIGGGGGEGDTSNKFFIHSQGQQGGMARVILNIKCRAGSGAMQYNVAIDGGDEQTETNYEFPRGTWHDVQLEIRRASDGQRDGGWQLWVNSNTKPTLVRKGIRLATSDSYVILGGYNNHGLAKGGRNNFRIADFEVGTAFDPKWDRP